MEQYFQEVVSELSIDDLRLLGFLFDHESTASFKSVTNIYVMNKCGFTEANLRKSVYRLVANKFISIVLMKRQQSFFITQWGVSALKKSINEVSA